MARRVTTGILGGPVLGNLKASTNLITAAETNANITIEGNGTGVVEINDNLEIKSQNSLKLFDSSNNNSINLKSPTNLTSSLDLILPAAGPANGQILKSDGSGNLQWVTTTLITQEETTSSSAHAIYFGLPPNGTSATTTLNHESSSLNYQPSTGTLSITNLTATSITETSSIMLKENISPISNALDKILNLEGVNYTRKSNGKYEAGLIAEQVEKVAPELVESDGETKSIHYSRLSAYLIEAVKYLKDELDKVSK